MSKPIGSTLELIDVCRTAGLWYVGSFMLELLMRREEWEDPARKNAFVEDMHREYNADSHVEGTRVRINAMIRIIESGRVEEAMELVLAANDAKLGCVESKENAAAVLKLLRAGNVGAE